MRRLALVATVLAAAGIFAFEVAPTSEIGVAILVGMIALNIISGVAWLLSPKLWRETTTVRFWIILAVLMLAGPLIAKLR